MTSWKGQGVMYISNHLTYFLFFSNLFYKESNRKNTGFLNEKGGLV